MGKEAKIEVVDQHTGPWGNIGLDRIVFLKRSGATKGTLRHKGSLMLGDVNVLNFVRR